MARPKKNRIVGFNPEVSYFKPRGIPLLDLEEVKLTIDEREAIRLADLLGLSYEEAKIHYAPCRTRLFLRCTFRPCFKGIKESGGRNECFGQIYC